MRYPNASNWNRRRRVETLGATAARGKKLDRFNDAQAKRVLHATKGFRKLNVRRSLAEQIVSMAKRGWGGLDLAEVRKELRYGFGN